MDHLTTLDAGFLEAEDSDRHVSLAVGGLSIIEGPTPDYDAIATGLADRLLAVPRFRQVLRTHILDLAPPGWVDDPNFDLSITFTVRHFHTRVATLNCLSSLPMSWSGAWIAIARFGNAGSSTVWHRTAGPC